MNDLPKGGIVNGTYEECVNHGECVVSCSIKDVPELRERVKAGKCAKRVTITLRELCEIVQKRP